MEASRRRWAIVAVAGLGTLPLTLDSSLNIAFPAITASFDLNVALIQWLVIAYVLTTASLLLGCGRFADVAGRKTIFCIGLAAITCALTLCGFAPDYSMLLGFRILQGAAGAMIAASAPAIVAAIYAPEELGRALGVLNMVSFFGQTTGPIAGGYLTGHFSWRGVFLFRVPIALTALAASLAVVGESVDRTRRQRLDIIGAATLALSVVGFLLVLDRGRVEGYLSPEIILIAAAAGLALGAFIYIERTAPQPIIDLAMLTPGLLLANFANLLANLAMFAIWLLVPYYVVDVLRYPATAGGLLLAPCPLGMALAASPAGYLADRIGTRSLQVLGLAVESLGLYLVSRLGTASSYGAVGLALLVVGLGLGSFIVANMKYVMGALALERQGVAAGLVATMRTLGVVSGVSIAAAVFSRRRATHAAWLRQTGALAPTVKTGSFIGAFSDVFSVSTAVCIIAMLLALLPARTATAAATATSGIAGPNTEAS